MSSAPQQTTHNMDNLAAYICILEHMKESVVGLDEALQQGFIKDIKIVCFNMTKIVEDY
jgi:hypothetical protein